MAVQSSDMMRLLDQISDRELAEKIKARYYQDVESQTSYVQTRVGELEHHIEGVLRDTIGNTNDMISETIKIGKGNADRVEALHSTVQSGFSGIEQRFTEIDARFESLATEFDSFRENVRQEFVATADRTAKAVKSVSGLIDQIQIDLINVKAELETRRPFFAQIETNSQIIARMAEDFVKLKRDMLVDKIGPEERLRLTTELEHHVEVMPEVEKAVHSDIPDLKTAVNHLEERFGHLEKTVREFIQLYNLKERQEG